MALREGFTTGSAATAAAMAAFARLLGAEVQEFVSCPLPPFEETDDGLLFPAGRLDIPISSVMLHEKNNSVRALVIKDGGDDPDATHQAGIEAEVALCPAEHLLPHEGEIFLPGPPPLVLRGGRGIGRVTLPGLPVAVGEPAINPVPRKQILAGLKEVAAQYACKAGLVVTLSVPNGESIARKTLNPRLGILGGISILGTHGTVRPYSHDAWKASILEGLSVAQAVNCPRILLTTGRRSERLLNGLFPHEREQAFVQVADFAEFSLRSAVESGFRDIIWGCFFGKLVKLAQGQGHTHAHSAPLDMNSLALWCAESASQDASDLKRAIAACTTANQALDLILPRPDAMKILHSLAQKAKHVAESFAPGASVRLYLFSLDDDKELLHL